MSAEESVDIAEEEGIIPISFFLFLFQFSINSSRSSRVPFGYRGILLWIVHCISSSLRILLRLP